MKLTAVSTLVLLTWTSPTQGKCPGNAPKYEFGLLKLYETILKCDPRAIIASCECGPNVMFWSKCLVDELDYPDGPETNSCVHLEKVQNMCDTYDKKEETCKMLDKDGNLITVPIPKKTDPTEAPPCSSDPAPVEPVDSPPEPDNSQPKSERGSEPLPEYTPPPVEFEPEPCYKPEVPEYVDYENMHLPVNCECSESFYPSQCLAKDPFQACKSQYQISGEVGNAILEVLIDVLYNISCDKDVRKAAMHGLATLSKYKNIKNYSDC